MRVRLIPPCMSPIPGAGHVVAKPSSKPSWTPAGQFGSSGATAGAGCAPRPCRRLPAADSDRARRRHIQSDTGSSPGRARHPRSRTTACRRHQTPSPQLSAVRARRLPHEAVWRPPDTKRVVGRVEPVVHVPEHAGFLVLDVGVARLADAGENTSRLSATPSPFVSVSFSRSS